VWVLFIPWGLREQALFCGTTAVSYLYLAAPSFLAIPATLFTYPSLLVGVVIAMSLLWVSRKQTQRMREAAQILSLRRRLSEAESVQDLNHAVAVVTDMRDLVSPLTDAAHRLGHTDGLILGVFVPEAQQLIVYSKTDLSLHEQQFSVEEAFAQNVLQVGWPVHIRDLAAAAMTAEPLHNAYTC
jgi:hypothetical protein